MKINTNIVQDRLFNIIFFSLFMACVTGFSAFAGPAIGSGDYSTKESGGAGYYNCENTSDVRCPHWIKASIADFKTAWNNRVGSYTQSAYDICSDPSQNTDGYVVFAGKIQPSNTLRLHNILPMPFSNLGQSWKVVHKDWISAVYRNGSETKYNFFNDTTVSGITYRQLMNQLLLREKLAEKDAAFFCDGMLEPDEPDPTSFESQSVVRYAENTAFIDGGRSSTEWGTNTTNDMPPPYEVNTGTVYVSFSHALQRTDSVNSSADTSFWVETNDSSVPGKYSSNSLGPATINAGDWDTVYTTGVKAVSLSPGESKKICQTIRYTPQISSNSSSSGYSQACVVIKRSDLATFKTTSKVETVSTPTKSTTANSGEIKTLDITTKDSSIQLKFTHNLTRNPSSGSNNISRYRVKSSRDPVWNDDADWYSGSVGTSKTVGGDAETVTGLEAGKTRQVCQSVMIYPDKMKDGDEDSGAAATFSSVCVNIFREEDKIANFSASSTAQIGSGAAKNFTSDSVSTEVTNVTFRHDLTRTSVTGGADFASSWSVNTPSGISPSTISANPSKGASPAYQHTEPVVLNPGQTKTLTSKITYDKTIKNGTVTAKDSSTATAVVTRNLKSYTCPIDDTTVDQNSGTTKAQTIVRKGSGASVPVYTYAKSTDIGYSGNSRTVQVWAKPTDNIQFTHTLCFGAQAVRGGSERTTTPSTANTATISASATPSSSGNYLFGDSLSATNSRTFNLPLGTPASDISSSILPPTFSTKAGTASLKQNYYFTYNSPGRATQSSNPSAKTFYECTLTNGSNFSRDYDYQIRGKNGCSGITTSDVGKTIRQQITWNKVDASVNSSSPHGFTTDQSNGTYTDAAEVKVPYNYQLAITAKSDGLAAYSGSPKTVTATIHVGSRVNPTISDTAYATTSKPSGYRIITFTLGPDVAMPTGNSPLMGANYVSGSWNKDICAQYGLSTSAAGNNCQIVAQSDGLSEQFNKDANLGGSASDTYSKEVNVGEYPLGTKFCVAAGVYPADSHNTPDLPTESLNESAGLSSTGTTWNYSAINCSTVAKKPTVQFWGQSVYTAGGIKTGTSAKTLAGVPRIFGSWSEYDTTAKGIIASNNGRGFATGAAFGYVQGNGGSYLPSTTTSAPVSTTYATSGTYNISSPAGATNITVYAWGAGGGGGSSDDDSLGSTAGGGGFVAHNFGASSTGGTINVTVGAGGTGGASVKDKFNNGQNGGDTTVNFNSVTLTAGGGKGGGGAYVNLWGNGTRHGSAGAGGSASGGNIDNLSGTAGLKGGPEDGGLRSNAATRGAGGGSGGYNTAFGGGRGFKPSSNCYDNDDGIGYRSFSASDSGGGGSGACSIVNPYKGGNGAPGKVVVTYTPAPTTADPGGLPASNDPCTYSSQTFNNADCNKKVIGQSTINSANLQSTLDGLVSRYIDSSSTDNRSNIINLNGSGTCNLNASGTYTASVTNPGYKCLNNGAKYIRVSGSATLNAATLQKASSTVGGTVVLDITGSLTIAGNVTYADGPYNGIAELPQLLIFAENIYIKNDVTQIDAWLVAGRKGKSITGSGIINTCIDGKGTLPNTIPVDSAGNLVCSNQLKVNGSVFAQKLILNRAYGSGTGNDVSTPAEIFNLRSDTYMWAYAQAENYSQAITTYSRELAPRY
jgi:hypothetical protein